MKLDNKEIQECLEEEYQRVCKKYSKNKILGTFVLGKANYGFADSKNELNFFSIYIPSFDELCWGGKPRHDEVVDIRWFYQVGKQKELEFGALELLFSKFFIITKKYEETFKKYFLDNREKIGRCNDKMRLEQARDRFNLAYENKDYFEAARLWNGAYLYSLNASLEECYCPTNPLTISLMRSIKDGLTKEPDMSGVNFDELVEDASDETRYDAVAFLKEGVIKLIEVSVENSIPLEVFIETLTKTEKEAFNFLISKMENNEAIISISAAVTESGISRPVFKNLLLKIENEKIASVTNMGMKGTSIKMLV